MIKVVPYTLAILIALVFVSGALGLTVEGVLTGDYTWKLEDSPVKVRANVTVPDGASLKILPGVRVLFQGYYHLQVNGALEAVGDPNKMIVFTCEQRDFRKSLWKGLVVSGEKSRAIISDCIFEYSFRNLVVKSAPVIRSSIFRHNHYGLYFSNSVQSMVNKNRFFGNAYGVYCDFSSPILQENTISSNEFGVYCVFSSSPLIGQNILEKNTKENVFLDDSMGKNSVTARNQHLWMLVRSLL